MRGWLIALVAACAPKPAEPLEPSNNVPEQRAAARVGGELLVASAPRPELDISHLIPDFHDELRWPLTAMSHPSLEPRFGIAAVFAQPGIGWIELCERGADKRTSGGRNRDELEYLRGWCSAIKGDVDKACGRLVPLVGSAVLGLTPAVRIDLANILADHGDADKAEHWLTRHNINDPLILDTLAATYIEIGNERDAWTINRRAIDTDRAPAQETQCRRLVRHIVLGPEGERLLPETELERLAKVKIPDKTCVELHHAIRCWKNPADECAMHLFDRSIDHHYADLLRAYYSWPKGQVGEATWLVTAARARDALPLEGAYELTMTALETAIASQGYCSPRTYVAAREIETFMKRVLPAVPQHMQALVERCRDSRTRP